MPKHAGAKQQKEDRHCRIVHLLGVFRELQKATISCVMSVCLSVCMEQLGFHWTGFHLIFFKYLLRKLSFIKNWTRIMGTLRETNIYIYFLLYLAQFFPE